MKEKGYARRGLGMVQALVVMYPGFRKWQRTAKAKRTNARDLLCFEGDGQMLDGKGRWKG